MYPLWNLLKFVVAFAFRWAMRPHPWGCHCETCMAEYNAELNDRKRRIQGMIYARARALRAVTVSVPCESNDGFQDPDPFEKVSHVSDADLLSALVGLGYKAREASKAISQLGSEGSFQERFKAALQLLRRA